MEQVAQKPSVHKILAHSYAATFMFFLVGVCLDLFLSIKIFNSEGVTSVGFVLLAFGTFLIIWAQKTSRNLKKEIITKETFSQGPYSITRSPTHWGLFLATIGFGIVVNAFFVVLLSLVSFIFTKLTFLKEEEKLLATKYGEPYMEYKNSAKIF
jgi:protein-S-isoprenylcysteine O-methyltransferase Ste14